MIVVDTNVVSELMRPSPSPRVRDWIGAQDVRELFTSSVTVAEVLYGIERLPSGRRQAWFRSVATELFAGFADQVLAFDAPAAVHYSLIVSRREQSGRAIDGFDAQIAAICRAQGAALATRNITDFQETGVELINPWESQDISR